MARTTTQWGWPATLVVVGAVLGFVVVQAIWPKRAAALPVPKLGGVLPGPTSAQLYDRVQQERKDELGRWYIVKRNALHMLDSIAASRSAGTGVEEQWRATLANANSHITVLEREIAAHGG